MSHTVSELQLCRMPQRKLRRSTYPPVAIPHAPRLPGRPTPPPASAATKLAASSPANRPGRGAAVNPPSRCLLPAPRAASLPLLAHPGGRAARRFHRRAAGCVRPCLPASDCSKRSMPQQEPQKQAIALARLRVSILVLHDPRLACSHLKEIPIAVLYLCSQPR